MMSIGVSALSLSLFDLTSMLTKSIKSIVNEHENSIQHLSIYSFIESAILIFPFTQTDFFIIEIFTKEKKIK